MKFTDLFIRKPVLALVVSLFILLFGLRAFSELNVRQYPEMRNAVVNVSTTYFGADADLTAYVAGLTALRRQHPGLRHARWFSGQPVVPGMDLGLLMLGLLVLWATHSRSGAST